MKKIIRHLIIPVLLPLATSSNTAAFRHLAPFMFPMSVMRARGDELPGCFTLSSRITCSSKARSNNFPKTDRLYLSLPFSRFISASLDYQSVPFITRGELSSFSYLHTKLMCEHNSYVNSPQPPPSHSVMLSSRKWRRRRLWNQRKRSKVCF